ncbi:hypothetical protein KEU06_04595 [Pseudaminobacter sp. 19-2017]|uniref:Uncharacterized protein n=1 Tax=Pseudaminobacter soli (ex Zhang et al. 2022) TaxID=2831468 RepID=A0A942E3M8_9HYPH|nr:hypothetical protein [Pseudaminobacter soli]MBS3647907.1 hypothetical protein [Pseudaminobacter soli]
MATSKMFGNKRWRLLAGVAALVISGAAVAAEIAYPLEGERLALVAPQIGAAVSSINPAQPSQDETERFADAPYGVDAMVTGPVSAAFKQQQERLGCAEAEWPNIPTGCYPD